MKKSFFALALLLLLGSVHALSMDVPDTVIRDIGFTISVKPGASFDRIEVYMGGEKIVEKGMGEPWINEQMASQALFFNNTLFVSINGISTARSTITVKVIDDGAVVEENSAEVTAITPLESSYRQELRSELDNSLEEVKQSIGEKISSLQEAIDAMDYSKIQTGLEEVRQQLSGLSSRLDSTEAELKASFDEKKKELEARVDALSTETEEFTSTGFISLAPVTTMNPLLALIGVLTFVAVAWFGLFMMKNPSNSIYGEGISGFGTSGEEPADGTDELGKQAEKEEYEQKFKGRWAFLSGKEKPEAEEKSKGFHIGDLIKKE